MKESILHILVIWSKAQSAKKYIEDDLSKDFEIIKKINVKWDKKLFIENYKIFYAHSQKDLSYVRLHQLMKYKRDHCGDGNFTAIIFKDHHPIFEERQTSGGVRLVNTHIFDKKSHYREITGGGHKIHCSDDAWETNKDLTLMFGLNTDDFCKKYEGTNNKEELEWHRNCVGVGGYKDIQELFYVLNNVTNYVVMRNHECIPNEYTVEGHGDIDLLVEHKNYVAYVTGAKPVFSEPYRVYHTIIIGGETVPFDFRFVGDNYYDKPWQQNILNTRILVKDLFYTPDAENQFYSLLYHAYVQKWEVKDDYPPKLKMYAKQIGGVLFNNNVKDAIEMLDGFMKRNGYEYIKPYDKTVAYNTKNLKYSSYAFRYGTCIKRLVESPIDERPFTSTVFEKKDSFVKTGMQWLIDNEVENLNKLKSDFYPKVIRHERINEDESMIEITRMNGVPADVFFADGKNCSVDSVKSFIMRVITILEDLKANGLSHRDVFLPNFIIYKDEKSINVSLIDFGWATELSNLNRNRPKQIGENNGVKGTETDFQLFSSVLRKNMYKMPYLKRVANVLDLIDEEILNDTKRYNTVIETLRRECCSVSFVDYLVVVPTRILLIIRPKQLAKKIVTKILYKFK